jgi:hypothetical protein
MTERIKSLSVAALAAVGAALAVALSGRLGLADGPYVFVMMLAPAWLAVRGAALALGARR